MAIVFGAQLIVESQCDATAKCSTEGVIDGIIAFESMNRSIPAEGVSLEGMAKSLKLESSIEIQGSLVLIVGTSTSAVEKLSNSQIANVAEAGDEEDFSIISSATTTKANIDGAVGVVTECRWQPTNEDINSVE